MLAASHEELLNGVEKKIAARALEKCDFEYGWVDAREVQVHIKPEVLEELEASLGDVIMFRCETSPLYLGRLSKTQIHGVTKDFKQSCLYLSLYI